MNNVSSDAEVSASTSLKASWKAAFSVAAVLFGVGVCAAAPRVGILREYAPLNGAENAPLPGAAAGTNLFADAGIWKRPENFRKGLEFRFDDGTFTVAGARATNRFDTAWVMAMKPQPLTEKGLGYVVSFGVSADPRVRRTTGGRYFSAVFWYDSEGNEICRDPFPLHSKEGERIRFVFLGSVPLAAEKFAVQFGFDGPNLLKGDHVTFDSLALHILPRETDPAWTVPPVAEAPRIKVESESPFSDPMAELRISVRSLRPLDWSTLGIRLDGKPATKSFKRDGDILVHVPGSPWSPGLHRVDVTIGDPVSGEPITARKFFLRGDVVKGTPLVTLRDDGMTLVDGVPFFPIGVYGLREREFNGYDMDRALRELSAGGFNFVNSYRVGRTKKFLDCVHRHGMKAWTPDRLPKQQTVDELRHHPAILSWYVGDDTSMHFTPTEVYDHVDGVRAVDKTRITCQADVMNSSDPISSYRPYAKITDVFMPEVYPVRDVQPCPSPMSVPLAIRDMKRFRRDNAEAGISAPRGIWPIIQYFKGWGAWKRYPTRDELYAMTFATIAHGAHGITFYTYGGEIEPERKRFNYGITSFPEVWSNVTNLAYRISRLAPVLTERTPLQPPPPKILSGPEKDALDHPSVSVLLKKHGDDVYVIAVNGTLQDVTADFDLGVDATVANVLWENDRRVPIKGGRLVDSFAPLAVHVYRIRK